MKMTRIVIAGGGFAGLYAAMHFDKRLARRADVEVTLISRENFILFTPMLHEVAAGDLYPGDIVNPLRRILRHVKFIDADVQAVDLNARCVHCKATVADRELEFEFDHLLLTLGSETNFFNMDVVRDKDGTTPIEDGDAFIFKPGEPHQITNDTTEDMILYVVADNGEE